MNNKMEFKDFVSDKFNELFEQFVIDKNKQNLLYEGLIKTYGTKETFSIIKNTFPNLKIQINKPNKESISIIFEIKTKKDIDFEKLIQLMNTCGWFLAFPKDLEKELLYLPDNKEILLRFEAKYDVEMTDYIKEKQLRLYHITPEVNLKKIKQIGLSPKSNSKMLIHPERLYFFTNEFPYEYLGEFVKKIFNTNKNDFNLKNRYVLLEVELSKYDNPPIRFFNDPNLNNAIYTLEPVHPRTIETKVIFDLSNDNVEIIDVF